MRNQFHIFPRHQTPPPPRPSVRMRGQRPNSSLLVSFRRAMGSHSRFWDLLRRTVRLSLFFSVCFILSFHPPLLHWFHRKARHLTAMNIPGYEVEDYADSWGKVSNMMLVLKRTYLDVYYKTASLNQKAPNPKVMTSDGQKEVNLLDTAKPGRPLVLNFGSCS